MQSCETRTRTGVPLNDGNLSERQKYLIISLFSAYQFRSCQLQTLPVRAHCAIGETVWSRSRADRNGFRISWEDCESPFEISINGSRCKVSMSHSARDLPLLQFNFHRILADNWTANSWSPEGSLQVCVLIDAQQTRDTGRCVGPG